MVYVWKKNCRKDVQYKLQTMSMEPSEQRKWYKSITHVRDWGMILWVVRAVTFVLKQV